MKNRIISISLGLFVLAVFNTLFFLWTDADRSAVAWISYGFITAAFLWLLAALHAPRSGGNATYALTLPYVAGAYLGVELVAGVVLMIVTRNVAVALSVQLLLLTLYLLRFGMHHMANSATAEAVAVHKGDVRTLRDMATEVKMLAASIDDPAAAKAFSHLYDTVWCSPVSGASDPRLQRLFAENMEAADRAVAEKDWAGAVAAARRLEMLFDRKRSV